MNGWIETQEQIDERWSCWTFEAAKVETCLRQTSEDEADLLHELIVLCNSDPAHIFRATDGSDNSVSGQWSEHGYY